MKHFELENEYNLSDEELDKYIDKELYNAEIKFLLRYNTIRAFDFIKSLPASSTKRNKNNDGT